MQTNTLRPGILVALKTSLRGAVSYRREEIEVRAEGAAVITRAEVTRTVHDAEEHSRAIKVRSDATYTLQKVCARTDFGLLCPNEREGELIKAIDAALAMVATFNAEARTVRLGFYVIPARVAADDVQAIRSIRAEVVSLVDAMQAGVSALDAEAIRAAAKKAKEVGEMLSDGAQSRVNSAIEEARKAASAIAKAARAGEVAAAEIDAKTLSESFALTRLAFLDADGEGGAAVFGALEVSGRAVDLEPAKAKAAKAAPARALDI